ncbi:hypothetical protein BSKO_06013 [Bryopsis sp. KO-2023]|nr:hypothetical protein BSKO_06013 [Bryopsis sp. KO-2023]
MKHRLSEGSNSAFGKRNSRASQRSVESEGGSRDLRLAGTKVTSSFFIVDNPGNYEAFPAKPWIKQVNNVTSLHIGDHLSATQTQQVQSLLCKYGHLFAQSLKELRSTSLLEMPIDLKPGVSPICPKHIKQLSPKEEQACRARVNKLLETGINEEDHGPWGSQCMLVPKPRNAELRLCHNYVPLSKVTIPEKCIDMLAGHKIFTILDGSSEYFVVPIKESDIPKTAFLTPYGKFHYKRMPFGLRNAPTMYSRLNDKVQGDLLGR